MPVFKNVSSLLANPDFAPKLTWILKKKLVRKIIIIILIILHLIYKHLSGLPRSLHNLKQHTVKTQDSKICIYLTC